MGYTVDFDEGSQSFVGVETEGEGTLRFTSASSVSPIVVLEDAYLNDGSTAGFAKLEVDLETNPAPAGNILLVDVGGTLTGEFMGLPEGAAVPNSGGRTITYTGGDGNDIYLIDPNAISGDFDGNGLYECADVDALVAEIVAGTNNSTFDLTGDTLVNDLDLDAWRAEAGSVGGLTASGNPVQEGDATLDGLVDGGDFLVWNTNKFTDAPGWCAGDFNADGTVDGADFLLWNTNKFTTADGVSAVPEPAALLLVLGSLFTLGSFSTLEETHWPGVWTEGTRRGHRCGGVEGLCSSVSRSFTERLFYALLGNNDFVVHGGLQSFRTRGMRTKQTCCRRIEESLTLRTGQC